MKRHHIKIGKTIDGKYLYDFGFGYKYYTCSCGSHKVLVIPLGGFQPPDLICEDCGETVINTYKYYREENPLLNDVCVN